jgi:hypothetical protein
MSLKENIQATVGQNQSNGRLEIGQRTTVNSNLILEEGGSMVNIEGVPNIK